MTRAVVSGTAILLLIFLFLVSADYFPTAFNENVFTATAIGLIAVITIVIVPVLSLISSPEAM